MTKQYILAIDQGTTGSTALLVDRSGQVRGRGYAEIDQYFPQPGWVEQDPADIWRKTLHAIEIARSSAGADDTDIAAIGITNQRETTLLIDRETGEATGPAIVWQCRRTASRCDELCSQGLAEMIREKTGLVIDAYFSGTKLDWLLCNYEGIRRRAEQGKVLFANVDTWLIWKLTGGDVHATDVSNASRTMLFNIHTLDWDDDLLRILNIPRAMLPEVRPSSDIFGYTARGIPIAGVAGDQQAALFGQACFKPGMVKATLGTGAFVLMNTGAAPADSKRGLITTVAWGLQDAVEYALEGSIFVAGAVVQWLRDELGLIVDAAETERLALEVDDTGGVYFVPAFAGLGAPHWDMYARGTIVGLTRGTRKSHLVRAALESIAYQVSDVVKAMAADSGLRPAEIRVDGGAAANSYLAQYMADMIGVRVSRPRSVETTALGAAFLAGLAVGFWSERAEITSLWDEERSFIPNVDRERRRTLYRGWRKAVSRSRRWARDSL
ncbi:MAG: glycerol kinase GlpK [Dehalococcoidia bacterium]|nr:MAG: glycerol kinase GlpK [Dehalococcoidia bacterium]